MIKVAGVLAACALLSACGDDGGGAASGSVSSGSTTTTPSSPPSQRALTTGEVKPTSDATFIAASMDVQTTGSTLETNGIITGGTTSNRVTALDPSNFSVSYSSTSGYRLADAINYATFGPAQLTSDTTSLNGNGTVLFKAVSGSAEDYLALYQASTYVSSSKGMGSVTAKYGGVAGWQHTYVNGSVRQTRLDYFGYGPVTPVAAMPHAGTVQFSILNAGNYATNTDLWFLQQESGAYLTVDFSAGTITGNITLSGKNFYKSVVGGIGSIPIKATFSGNSLVTSFSNGSIGTSGGVPGQYHLVFVGPAANELIITYVANDGSQAAVGAAVGIANPYLL